MSDHTTERKVSLIHLLLFFVTLIPFSASVLSVRSFELAEIVVPILFVVTMINFIMNGANVRLIKNEHGNKIGLFLGLFMVIIILNYIRYPLLPSSLVEHKGDGFAGGFKTYFRFISGFMTFVIIIYWVNFKKIKAETVLRMFSWVVLIVVAIGLYARITGHGLPGLDTHRWAGKVTAGFSSTAGSVRNPILEQFSQIALFLSLSGAAYFGKKQWRLVAVIVFFGGVYLGGGRTALLTVIGGLMVFLFLRRRFLLTGIMFGSIIFMLLTIQVIHEFAPNAQIAKMTDLGSLKEASIGRHYIYKYGLQAFKENPIFGTGYGQNMDIGYIRIGYRYEDPIFIEKQLRMGGHGTHVALLKNLGLAGYIPFMLMWITAAIALLPTAMSHRPTDEKELTRWRQAQFIIVYFSAMFVRMMVEGNGSDYKYYVYVGLGAVVLNEILASKRKNRPKTAAKSILYKKVV